MYSASSRGPTPHRGGATGGQSTGHRHRGNRRGGQRAREKREGADAQSDSDDGRVRTAADLDRDARAGFDTMRELLKAQPPWSRDVESLRQKVRNYHQTLIFNHPVHPLAQSLDPIWIRTTYTLIVSFRDLVARAEATLNAAVAGAGGRRLPRNSPSEQELRKILTRFRLALSSEEGFYRQLVVRVVKHFGMESLCRAGLSIAGMSLSAPDLDLPDNSAALGPDSHAPAPLSPEEKKEKLGLVYKALICLGDIERYKEQYSDAYRREKAGARQAKGVEIEEKFGRAKPYYDAARHLLPEDGSAYNQLAVISTYLNDDFGTIYNYLRALAIKVPFKSISEIIDRYLKKAFEKFIEQRNDQSAATATGSEAFNKELVAVVAALYRQNGLSQYAGLKASILPNLSELLCARSLPSESIVRLTAIAVGLHWHVRSLASIVPATTENAHPQAAARTQQAEDSALDFLLCIFIVLLTISSSEVEEVMKGPGWTSPADSAIADDEGAELHTSISAVLRRILPSLRIISKWTKLHLDYLARIPISGTTPPNPLDVSVPTFWSAYYRLIEALARVFPLGMLPSLDAGLEEDDDMRGFLPISRGLIKNKKGADAEEVHPNEEQLMRIADLQVDATLILQAQTSGYAQMPEPESEMIYSDFVDVDMKAEDDYASVSTETEDDPVNMAMRASLGGSGAPGISDDEADDQPHWNGYSSASQATPGPQIGQPRPTAVDLLQNLVLDNTANPSNTTTPQGHSQRNSMSFGRALPSPRMSASAQPGSGSPGLLFGGEGIWTMTRDESQKGIKRDAADNGQSALSRPASEGPKSRMLGAEGVKAIWDAPGTATGSTFGTPTNGLGQDRRVSNGASQGRISAPMDAAQLFAGISGFGPPGGHAGSAAWDGRVMSAAGGAGDLGAIGRPSLGSGFVGADQPAPTAQSAWGASGIPQASQGGFGQHTGWG